MDYLSAPCESAWIIAGRKRLRPLAPCLATYAVRASPPYITTPPRQSVFNELIAARHWRGPSQYILNVFPIRPHGCVAHHLGSSMCRERGSPPLVTLCTRGRDPLSMPGRHHAAEPPSRCWPRPVHSPAEGFAPVSLASAPRFRLHP